MGQFKKRQIANPKGRPKGSKGAQVKSKGLQKWGKIFSDLGEEELKKLCQENFVEFMRIGVSLMPKDEPNEPGNQDSNGNGYVHGITKETKKKIREEIYGIPAAKIQQATDIYYRFFGLF